MLSVFTGYSKGNIACISATLNTVKPLQTHPGMDVNKEKKKFGEFPLPVTSWRI